MKCKHGYEVDANGNHIIIPKKYEVLQHETGIKYEVVEHAQEEPKTEQKPVSLEQIKKLYNKEFPPTPKPNINEVKRLHKLLNDT